MMSGRTARDSIFKWAGVAIVSALLGIGCTNDDQSGIPQPWPIPKPSHLRSTGAQPLMPTSVHLIGLPGAVDERVGTVTVMNGDVSVEAISTEAGSFSLFIDAKEGDELEVRIETSDPATFKVPADITPPIAPAPPGPIDGVAAITPVADPEGWVEVRGKTEDTGVVVVNIESGDVASAAADSKSEFTVEIAGKSGQTLHVYDDLEPLGAPWIVKIP